jgi:RNA polymerase sigma factor (TIGR02999 family)
MSSRRHSHYLGEQDLASSALAVTSGSGGVADATDALFSSLYFELHRLARMELARLRWPSRISVTTLLHEAYLDMAERATSFPDRARFMGYSARVMRGLIIDHVRTCTTIKRGAEFEITSLSADISGRPVDFSELCQISDALNALPEVEPELAELVELKFFCGFSFAEVAALQKLSERTVQRRWGKARIYLRHCISGKPVL